jgi:hypothetical protein
MLDNGPALINDLQRKSNRFIHINNSKHLHNFQKKSALDLLEIESSRLSIPTGVLSYHWKLSLPEQTKNIINNFTVTTESNFSTSRSAIDHE